jgi:DNA helicase-2/ATP-dependent DNA helicase PcrA
MTRAEDRLFLTAAARRRVFGEYQSTRVSPFVSEVPAHLLERHDNVEAISTPRHASGYQSRPGSYGSRGQYPSRRPAASTPPDSQVTSWRHEDEDQRGGSALRPGARVRHAHFGVGTVLSVEGYDADVKVTVRFAVGQKRLVARFARLEPA